MLKLMPTDSRYKWYVLNIFLFFFVNVFLLWQLSPTISSLEFLRPYQLIIFGLAVYRGANIISNETVTKPLRRPFITTFKRYGKEQEKARERGFRGAMGMLLTCPSCTGVWVATTLVYGYLLAPAAMTIFTTLLALSAIERIIARVLELFREKQSYTT